MFPEKIHRYIFLLGLCGLGFGMMVGTVPTSVPQLVLAGNWLLEGDFKRKWEQLKLNKIFWVLISLFLIHVVGLIYTQDLNTGLTDAKIKLPLILLPLLLFSSRPVSLKEFYVILYCFIAGSVVNTLWCLLYSFVLHQNETVRNASRFMSHIRLGLYLNVAIATCVYFAIKAKTILQRSWFILLTCYFIFVLYILGLASGIANFVILFLLALCVFIYYQKIIVKLAGLVFFAIFVVGILRYVYTIKNYQLNEHPAKNNTQQKFSLSGRPYIHFEKKGQKENGNYVQINIQPYELQKEWKNQFPLDSFDYSTKLNVQRYEVLLRYMASKGLNKDSAGIAALSAEDKKNIQNNISNYEYPSWSFLHKRTYELINEYDEFVNNRVVSGHSLTMRLYFWKATVYGIKQNLLFGVGTGDVQQELNKVYVETRSPLTIEWYKRPHNQFLSVTMALGGLGLLIFLISIIYPLVFLKKELHTLYWPFFLIVILSFFMEDTLETQAGCTFYAFFSTLFLSLAWFYKYSDNFKKV